MDSVEAAVSAVQEAIEDPVGSDPIRRELECLWDDLDQARRQAYNGKWSIGCDSVVYRITNLTRWLGRATPWGDVPFPLLLDGTYQKMHEAMGIEPETFDMERLRQTWAGYLESQR